MYYRNAVAAIAMSFQEPIIKTSRNFITKNTGLLRLYILAATLFIISINLKSQQAVNSQSWQLNYTAYKNGKEIGWSKISVSRSGNQVYIVADSKLDIQVLFTIEAKAHVTNRFLETTITTLSAFRTVNGKVKLDNNLENSNGTYVALKGDLNQQLYKPISNTVLSLYLNEPRSVKEVFSEVYMVYIPVNQISPSVYQTPLPDGGTMTYYYSNSRLFRVIAKTFYGTVQFELNK